MYISIYIYIYTYIYIYIYIYHICIIDSNVQQILEKDAQNPQNCSKQDIYQPLWDYVSN